MLIKCNGQVGKRKTGWAGPRGTDRNMSNSSLKLSWYIIGKELNMNQFLTPWRPPMWWDMTTWVCGHGNTLSLTGMSAYLGLRWDFCFGASAIKPDYSNKENMKNLGRRNHQSLESCSRTVPARNPSMTHDLEKIRDLSYYKYRVYVINLA